MPGSAANTCGAASRILTEAEIAERGHERKHPLDNDRRDAAHQPQFLGLRKRRMARRVGNPRRRDRTRSPDRHRPLPSARARPRCGRHSRPHWMARAPSPMMSPASSAFGAALRSIRAASDRKVTATLRRADPRIERPAGRARVLLDRGQLVGGKLDAGGDQRVGLNPVGASGHHHRGVGDIGQIDQHQRRKRCQNPQHGDDDEAAACVR